MKLTGKQKIEDNNLIFTIPLDILNTPQQKLNEWEEKKRNSEEVFAINLIVEFLKTRKCLSVFQIEKILDQAKDILRDTSIDSFN